MGEFRFAFDARDYDASVRFYRDLMALPLAGDWDRGSGDRGSLFRAAEGLIEVLEMVPGAVYSRPANARIVFEVPDVDAEYRRLRALGLEVPPPVSYPWGHRATSLRDPDGIRIMMFTLVTPPSSA